MEIRALSKSIKKSYVFVEAVNECRRVSAHRHLLGPAQVMALSQAPGPMTSTPVNLAASNPFSVLHGNRKGAQFAHHTTSTYAPEAQGVDYCEISRLSHGS